MLVSWCNMCCRKQVDDCDARFRLAQRMDRRIRLDDGRIVSDDWMGA